jgi:hypothetical protein
VCHGHTHGGRYSYAKEARKIPGGYLREHAKLSEEVGNDLLLGSSVCLVAQQNGFKLGGAVGIVPHGSQLGDYCQSDHSDCQPPGPAPSTLSWHDLHLYSHSEIVRFVYVCVCVLGEGCVCWERGNKRKIVRTG